MQIKTEFVIERGEEEIELTILGDVEPYIPANLSGHPDNWTPPEGGHACVEVVLLGDQLWDGELTSEEEKKAEEALFRALEDDEPEPEPDSWYDRYLDDQADYLYDPF